MSGEVQVKKNTGLDAMAGENFAETVIGGKTYKLGAPSVQDHAKFVAELQADRKVEATEYLKTLKDAGIGDELCVQEYNKKMDMENVSPMAWTLAMNTLKGTRYYFYVSAKKYDPEISRGKVEEIVTEDNQSEVLGTIMGLMPQGDPEKNVLSGEM